MSKITVPPVKLSALSASSCEVSIDFKGTTQWKVIMTWIKRWFPETLVYFIRGIPLENDDWHKVIHDQRGTNDTKYCRTSSSLKRPLFHAFLGHLLTGRVSNIHSSLLNLFHTERQRWHAVACKRSHFFGRRSGWKGSTTANAYAFVGNGNSNVLNRASTAGKSFSLELLKSAPTYHLWLVNKCTHGQLSLT